MFMPSSLLRLKVLTARNYDLRQLPYGIDDIESDSERLQSCHQIIAQELFFLTSSYQDVALTVRLRTLLGFGLMNSIKSKWWSRMSSTLATSHMKN